MKFKIGLNTLVEWVFKMMLTDRVFHTAADRDENGFILTHRFKLRFVVGSDQSRPNPGPVFSIKNRSSFGLDCQ